jgi:hypothetical protein
MAASAEAYMGWARPIGVLFIVGSHEYEDVLQDHLDWSQHLVDGGIIAFHDSTACLRYGWGGYDDVRRVVNRHILGSTRFRRIGPGGTVTYGVCGPRASPGGRVLNAEVRVRKVLWDLVVIAKTRMPGVRRRGG